MKNQIKVDKNRKGILFFLDFGPLICGGGHLLKSLLMPQLQPSDLMPLLDRNYIIDK
jgi:hypothetical protein